MPTIAALIVAAGSGTRAATSGAPKQYATFGGLSLLAHALKPFLLHQLVHKVRVVIRAEDRDRYAAAISPLGHHSKLLASAIGGEERQISVCNGLDMFSNDPPDLILIHDAARPFVTNNMISNVISAMSTGAAAILASRLTDTLKKCTPAQLISQTISRDNIWRAETPQAFRYDDIIDAHRRAQEAGMRGFTDDLSIAEWAGIPVSVVDSGGNNMKITTADDVVMAAQKLSGNISPDIRTGQGIDVHKFKDGSFVWICGI